MGQYGAVWGSMGQCVAVWGSVALVSGSLPERPIATDMVMKRMGLESRCHDAKALGLFEQPYDEYQVHCY